MTNNEMNKDNNQSIEEQNIPDVTMKNSKETKYRSGLLSFAFYLSIIYLVLFVLLFTLAGPWGIVLERIEEIRVYCMQVQDFT